MNLRWLGAHPRLTVRRISILVKYFDFAILLLVKVRLFLKGRKYIRLLECEQIMHHFKTCHLEIPNTHFYRIREEGGSGRPLPPFI